VGLVGGKNASLGEMIRSLTRLGVRVPDGFAITADAYRHFLREAGVEGAVGELLSGLRRDDVHDLVERSAKLRSLITSAELPAALREERSRPIENCPADIQWSQRTSPSVPRDGGGLAGASFAGQQDTYLNIQGEQAVLDAVRRCFASLFTARAIGYREDMGFDHLDVALSVASRRWSAPTWPRRACSSPSTRRAATAAWRWSPPAGPGRGGGARAGVPDQFYVHKPTLRDGHRSLCGRRRQQGAADGLRAPGSGKLVELQPVPDEMRSRACLSDDEVLQLARWALQIEDHYARARGADSPMDIEWGKDGQTGELFILQARPETVHSNRKGARAAHLPADREGRAARARAGGG